MDLGTATKPIDFGANWLRFGAELVHICHFFGDLLEINACLSWDTGRNSEQNVSKFGETMDLGTEQNPTIFGAKWLRFGADFGAYLEFLDDVC